ncbi:hypothetical protein B7463_g1761, partial [Scytalidium lignicola]
MASPWVPHGLIQHIGLETPYQNAKHSIDEHGNLKDAEYYTTIALFEDLFHHIIFSSSEYKSNSLVLPSTKSDPNMACDIVTSYIDDDNYHWHFFCFSEVRGSKSATAGTSIRALEEQVLEYCKEYLQEQPPEVNLVYANTLVGASIRSWSYRRGEGNLSGFSDSAEYGNFGCYKDIGEESNRRLLEDTFGYIKKYHSGSSLAAMG